jgi:hypothetical protein
VHPTFAFEKEEKEVLLPPLPLSPPAYHPLLISRHEEKMPRVSRRISALPFVTLALCLLALAAMAAQPAAAAAGRGRGLGHPAARTLLQGDAAAAAAAAAAAGYNLAPGPSEDPRREDVEFLGTSVDGATHTARAGGRAEAVASVGRKGGKAVAGRRMLLGA